MGLKDNFYQAMKELLNNGGLVGSDLEEKAKGHSDLDSYLETPPAAPGAEVPPYQQRQQAQQQTQPQSPYAPQNRERMGEGAPRHEGEPPRYDAPPGGAAYSSNSYQTNAAGADGATPYYRGSAGYGEGGYDAPAETTIISKNTLVEGNIRSFANIFVQGNVRGDVSVTKDARLSGKVIGTLKCNNLEMNGSSVQGDVLTKGRAELDGDSLLLGDLSAQYADVNGKVKGNLNVTGKTEFRSDAVILGDVKTSAITVMDGANIQGFIDTTFLRDNADKVFPGSLNIGEDGFTAQEAAQ